MTNQTNRTPVKSRLEKRQEEDQRKYGVPCKCECACKSRFRFGAMCTLCRDGNHYVDLDSYLAQVEERSHA